MSIHGLLDQVGVGLGAKFIPQYFRESIASPTFPEHLQGVSLKLPEIEGEGDYEISAATLAGELEAAFRLAQWLDNSCPSIIYHHGAAEIPYDYGFRRIFPFKRQKIKANLFLVRAPFHRSMREFRYGIRTLSNFVALLAVSVTLIEHLVRHNRKAGSGKILVAGTSLGGYITNLHHIYYNSAHVYTPLLAGLAMDDTFLRSVYSRGVASLAKKNAPVLESILNFESAFAATDKSNVFPLLGTDDQIIRYERQKASYGDCPVATLKKGHITGAQSVKDLRRHILEHLGRCED